MDREDRIRIQGSRGEGRVTLQCERGTIEARVGRAISDFEFEMIKRKVRGCDRDWIASLVVDVFVKERRENVRFTPRGYERIS